MKILTKATDGVVVQTTVDGKDYLVVMHYGMSGFYYEAAVAETREDLRKFLNEQFTDEDLEKFDERGDYYNLVLASRGREILDFELIAQDAEYEATNAAVKALCKKYNLQEEDVADSEVDPLIQSFELGGCCHWSD